MSLIEKVSVYRGFQLGWIDWRAYPGRPVLYAQWFALKQDEPELSHGRCLCVDLPTMKTFVYVRGARLPVVDDKVIMHVNELAAASKTEQRRNALQEVGKEMVKGLVDDFLDHNQLPVVTIQ